MPSLSLKDGTEIYYKDWGNKSGPVVTFSHGWPLSSDNWDSQMFSSPAKATASFLATDVAMDGQANRGREMTWTHADDLHQLFEALDLRDAVMVGHSTGVGEVARFIGLFGTDRVKKAVLIGAVPPITVQSEPNPGHPAVAPSLASTAPTQKTSQGQIYSWWQQGMMASFKVPTTSDAPGPWLIR
ncbi:Alpha/Beta hydrolase protein [Lasiosphaeria miniovina]|uniref:Alpha/Beta hydrolase protein n=1 Tax=Lasiosphaeria miniovina TaxID=1954250 RepID=A0AA40E5W6_9PEZI|nr:Alpha/Beta hydrolase protein [Lasiosphaeria miniovina]KAK0723603.1 Alpha/Beta hydrolase protein [Lasiosphaeria miniovina]